MTTNQPIQHDVSRPAVQVNHLEMRFGTFTAVSDLSFTIDPGEIFGLLGPNGSGKTTTLNMISGLTEPTGGEVLVFGMNPRKQSAAVRKLLGVVPQETALYGELTATQNLAFHAELFGFSGKEKKQRVAEMLELAQLTERAKSRVNTFSGGMKRRLAVVRAMLHNPRLLYLDEPTLGVDVQSRNIIWEYILQLKSEGRSVLLTTNYLDEANTLCNRIAIIDGGRLVALGTPSALKAAYGSSVVDLEVGTEVPQSLVNRVLEFSSIQSATVDGRNFQITIRNGANANASALVPVILNLLTEAGLGVEHMSLRDPSMDEVFLSLTGKGLRE